MQKLPSFLLCLAALAGLCACKQTSSSRRAAPYDQGPALFAVTSGDKFGYINAQGDIVIEPRFLRALSFSDGLGAVQTRPAAGVRRSHGQVRD
ncbi:MAG: WG repeat-containing protein [Bryobacterales bacterium]|nr:WG repeat-containing protein [Bryobacterales bacterium]